MNPGDEIAGRYRLEELRGRGAMSEVWRAHDARLDRTVALKMLSRAADRARFHREAHAAATLAHENVMRVYDYGEDAAGPYMALEWLPGGTLEERLANGALAPEETRRIAHGMAAGLAQLHARGIVHRDLKPANVLFDEDDRPKLADLGLARIAAGAGTLTAAGTVLGTAAYISPEQAAGLPAGPASDVYAFGVMLFRMLTGALPFASGDALELIHLHRTAEPPAVEELNPEAPTGLAALVAATLRKDPAARPHDGSALLATLEQAPRDSEQTGVLAPVAAAVGGRSPRRTAAVAAALLVLAAAGGALAWTVTRPSTPVVALERTTGVLGTSASRTGEKADGATSTHGAVSSAAATRPGTSTRQRKRRHHGTTTGTTTATTTQPATTAPPPTTTAPPTTTTAPPPTTTAPPPTTTAPPPTTTAPPPTTTAPTTTSSRTTLPAPPAARAPAHGARSRAAPPRARR